MAVDLGFRMHAERTPNPNSIKWVLGAPIVPDGQSACFEQSPEAGISPLAQQLFAVDGVTSVFMASNFVTVSKRDEVEWADIAEGVVAAIRGCLAEGGSALGPEFQAQAAGSDSPVVARIRQVLDGEIRPAVARDGGDIVFARFHQGIVEVYLQGSCSGCPSSTATLKHGIEARLRELIPEVEGVAAL